VKIREIGNIWQEGEVIDTPIELVPAIFVLEIFTHSMRIGNCAINLARIININLLHLSWMLSILNPLWANDSN
jgi:hypothetical protein